MLRVQGLASSQLFEPDNPAGPANRRISIIVMNREAEDRILRPGTPPEPEPAQESTLIDHKVVEPVSTFVPPAR